MSDQPFSVAPSRLVEADDELAEALFQHQHVAGQQARQPHFSRLVVAQEFRARRRSRRLVLGAAGLVGGLGLAEGWTEYRNGDREPNVQAEQGFDPMPEPIPAGPVSVEKGSTLAGAIDPAPIDPTLTRGAALGSSQKPNRASTLMRTGTGDLEQLTSAKEESNRDCGKLQKQGRTTEALSCYEQQAHGSGIRAELSYLERARLQQFVLNDPNAALGSITEYQARFPQGTLRPEATLSRIVLLARLGHGDEARHAIKSATLTMPEKAPALRELAVDLAVLEGNCSEARALVQQVPADQATELWKKTHLGKCRAL